MQQKKKKRDAWAAEQERTSSAREQNAEKRGKLSTVKKEIAWLSKRDNLMTRGKNRRQCSAFCIFEGVFFFFLGEQKNAVKSSVQVRENNNCWASYK